MIGKFLVDNGLITQAQLDDALELQKDNPNQVLGQLLVTMGVMTREDIVMAMEMFMITTNSTPSVIDEWLDQDEIDSLIEKIKSK